MVPDPALPADVLRALFDHVPDTMFFVKDAAARYVHVNDTMVRRSGKRRRAEILGRTVEELFPGDFGRNTTRTDLDVIARGEAVTDRLELYRVPGERPEAAGRWCLTHKYPLRDAAGRPSGLAGLSRDLPRPDERSALYGQLARFTELVAARLEGGMSVRALAREVGLSEDRLERGARQVFGLTPKQLVTKARVEAASHLLRGTTATVAQIAYRCGYADHSAFTRAFRAAVGLTPTQFRAAHEAGRDGPT